MQIVVTGCAGFIGSNFVEELLKNGHRIVGLDNLLLGTKKQMSGIFGHPRFRFFKRDLLKPNTYRQLLKNQDLVIHLAANSDIPAGLESTRRDLDLNTLATYHLLEAMRLSGIKKIIFASSSAVYGETKIIPTPENIGPLLPISLYGASKLACEGLCSSYANLFNMQAWIFRFGNVIGRGLTHGAIFDFVQRLKKDSKKLKVLGNGQQQKSYIYVQDCIAGMLFAFQNAKQTVNLYNLSSPDSITVREIAELTKKYFATNTTKIYYEKQSRGWNGDVVKMGLDTKLIQKLGWTASHTSRQAVESTLQDLCK